MAFSTPIPELIEANSNGLLGKHESWERFRLGDVVTVQNGAPFRSEHFNTEGRGMPLLRIRDVNCDETDTWYDGPYEEEYIVEPGDLVIGMDGDFNHSLWAGPRPLLNQRVCRLVFHSDNVLKRFVLHALAGYLKAVNDATSSVTVKHLSSKTVADLLLPLPPGEEQLRLVRELDRLGGLINSGREMLERAGKRLEAYQAVTLSALLKGQWRSLADRVQHDLASAERVPLRSIATIQYGYTAKASTETVGPRFLRITDIQDGEVDWGTVPCCEIEGDEEPRFHLQKGDLLFARIGATTGKSYLVKDDVPEAVFASYLIRVRPDERVLPAFLALFFESADYWRFISSQSRGIGRPAVNGKVLGALPVPVPSRAAQEWVVQEASRQATVSDQLRSGAQASRALANRLAESIMHEAVAGRLVPQDASDEPASELLVRIRAEFAEREFGRRAKRASRGARRQETRSLVRMEG